VGEINNCMGYDAMDHVERRQDSCLRHERLTERIATNEKESSVLGSKVGEMGSKIDVLFSKQDSAADMLTDIRLCMELIKKDVTSGFESQDRSAGELRTSLQKHSKAAHERYVLYDSMMKDFKEKLARFELSKGFLDFVNKTQNKIIPYILGIAGILVIGLAIVHFVDLMRLKELIK